jgi:hypothetical protein
LFLRISEAALGNHARNRYAHPEERHVSETNGSDSSAAGADPLAFLKSLGEASAIFIGFTYLGGWCYFAAYYGTFGLNSVELDLPLPVVSATDIYLMFSAGWPLLVVFALLLGWIVLSHWLKGFRRGLTAAILVLLLFAASTACIYLGRRHANEDMLIDSSELPNVGFSVKIPKTDQPDCVDHETYGSTDCKLLLHSKGTFYFFRPISDPKNALLSVGSLNLYTLADSDVTGVHVLRGLERNVREK